MPRPSLPYFERPLLFFDQPRFRQALAEQPPITVFKDAIIAASAQFDARFREGEDIRTLIHERAVFMDCLLHYAWHQHNWPSGISLEAVGGYGRCELHPYSDIDLLLLARSDEVVQQAQDNIEQLLALLWDIGLKVGHSVRTLSECVAIARSDITVATSLMESRNLQGDSSLQKDLLEQTSVRNLWPAEEFFRAKWMEQRERHQKYDDTEYNLEPNIKNAPGGLRDLQMIGWVAKRYFQVRTLRELRGQGLFTEAEFALLQSGEELLWRIRYGLHLIAGRAEERLLFDHQRELAKMFGYRDNNESLAVEQFMHRYYRLAMALRELNDVLLQFLHEVILQKGINKTVTAINERFQLRDRYIEAAHIYVFDETPSALLEIFVLMAKNPNIEGVRASTIRLIRESRHLIDDQYRNNPENRRLFIELFNYPNGLVEQLKRMSRYGVLGLYLPEFGRVAGQMQHDLFHIYTVDAHTLKVVENLCNFFQPSAKEEFPIAARLMPRLRKPELLYIAGLYHDIGKGRGGDHSTLGAIDARAFCQNHGLSQSDTHLVCWLVEQHLLMSSVSQKQDISDPDVIHSFALQMGNQTRLDYLYLLTIADINGTNQKLWNTWRASLMRQLYMETKRALRRGLDNNIDKQEVISETQQSALRKLSRRRIPSETVWQLWSGMGEQYFLRETAQDIAWHTEAMAHHRDDTPLILIKNTANHELEGATQIFIRSKGWKNVFAAVATALDQLNLNIQAARIYNSDSGYTLDTFFVLNQNGKPLGDDPRILNRIHRALEDELRLVDDYSEVITRRTPRRMKHFTMPTRTTISNDMISGCTVLEVISPDRPGLLACIGRIFLQFDILLQSAKIATLGERVEDTFFITDSAGEPLSDPAVCAALQMEICQQLDQRVTGKKERVSG